MSAADINQTGRWRRRKDARPAEILSAALACFSERGFAATRLEDVARRAGVTKGTLYLYFGSKEELFKAIVRQAILPNIERLEAMIGDKTERASVLIERIMTNLAEIISSPISAIPKLILAESGNFPDLAKFYSDEVVHRATALVRDILCRGIERGEFDQIDVESTVICIIAPFIFAMLWRHSLGHHEPRGIEPEALCHAHLRLVLGGLAAPSPGFASAARDTEAAQG